MTTPIATYLEADTHEKLVRAWNELGAQQRLVRYDDLSAEERRDVLILFGWNIPLDVVNALPRLAWIQGAGAGLDWIPEGISDAVVVTRMVDKFGSDMGEYVLMALLNWMKNDDRAREQQRFKIWEPYLTSQLSEITVGILGAGSIGGCIAAMLLPLVKAVRAMGRRSPSIPGVQGLSREQESSFFSGLDALVMVLPATQESAKVVGERQLAWMNPESYVINIGRGWSLDVEALQRSIARGHTSGAMLDVFDQEPLTPEDPLWHAPRIRITPHVAGPSRPQDMAEVLFHNLDRFYRGEVLSGIYHRERGY